MVSRSADCEVLRLCHPHPKWRSVSRSSFPWPVCTTAFKIVCPSVARFANQAGASDRRGRRHPKSCDSQIIGAWTFISERQYSGRPCGMCTIQTLDCGIWYFGSGSNFFGTSPICTLAQSFFAGTKSELHRKRSTSSHSRLRISKLHHIFSQFSK